MSATPPAPESPTAAPSPAESVSVTEAARACWEELSKSGRLPRRTIGRHMQALLSTQRAKDAERIEELTKTLASADREIERLNIVVTAMDESDDLAKLVVQNADLTREVERLQEEFQWLEEQARKSRTGISFDYCRHVEDGQVLERGYRFMRYHELGERKNSIREAIRAAMSARGTKEETQL